MRIDTHHHHKKAGQNLAFVFFMNLAFNIIVIAGGLATNSMAILADCIHDMSDTLSIGIAWILEKISQKDSSDNYSYGYQSFCNYNGICNTFRSYSKIICSGRC